MIFFPFFSKRPIPNEINELFLLLCLRHLFNSQIITIRNIFSLSLLQACTMTDGKWKTWSWMLSLTFELLQTFTTAYFHDITTNEVKSHFKCQIDEILQVTFVLCSLVLWIRRQSFMRIRLELYNTEPGLLCLHLFLIWFD